MEGGCKALITTSRSPSKRTRELVNDLVNSLPGVKKIVRGKRSFVDLLEEAVQCGARHLVLIWERRGMPYAILFYDVAQRRWKPYALKIAGVRSRRDFPAFVARRPLAKTAVVVDLAQSEVGEIFSEVFGYPLLYSLDVRGFDTIILVRREDGHLIVEFLGPDMGPRASFIKVAKVVYRRV